jgi:hypothetical protein
VLGLLGLARSGTTLLCSILGVHPGIEAVYEPFNAEKKRELPPNLRLDRFFAEFPIAMNDKEILLVKETGTQIAFLDRTAELLRSATPPIRRDLIVLLRNPLHAFLSILEARKNWWGGEHEISAEAFQSWSRHNLAALGRLLRLGREFNAVLVSYERLVADKERLVPELMRHLGLPFVERQLNFEQHVDRRQVRGDITIEKNPTAISDARVRERDAELAKFVDRIKDAADYPRVSQAAQLIVGFAETGIARFDTPAATKTIRPLLNLLAETSRLAVA